MRMRTLSTEQIQRTIDAFNHDRSVPMILVGSAAIKLHMRERMAVLTTKPDVDVLSNADGLQALIHEGTSGKTGPMSFFESDAVSGHVYLTFVPNDIYAQSGVVTMNAFTGFSDGVYDTSFDDARPTAGPDVQTGLLKMPLADILDWKLSINTTINDIRQIRDVLDVATIDGDLTSEQIAQFDERLRQRSAHARFDRKPLYSNDDDLRYLL